MKRPHFPITIDSKLRAARIYRNHTFRRTKEGKVRYDTYLLVWYEGTVRHREQFTDLAEALKVAKGKTDDMAIQEERAIRLPDQARLSFIRAEEALAPYGVAVDVAAGEYAAIRRLLKDRATPIEAARDWLARHQQDLPPRTVQEVVGELVRGKTEQGLSQRHIDDLESRLNRFAGDFKCQITTITGDQIREWIQGLKKATSPRSRNNYRLAIQGLVSFAKVRGYLPKDWDGMAAVPQWKETEAPVGIFTPEQFEKLLAAADSRLLPFVAIAGLSGLRQAEIERLDWAKVDLRNGHILVDASVAKTNSRRMAPITDSLKAWLTPYAKKAGPVCGYANVTNALMRLAKDAKVRWRHNGLRHSFCSYRVAATKNIPQVAMEAGNSPGIIKHAYLELVTEAQGKEWFAIYPAADAKTTALPAPENVQHVAQTESQAAQASAA